MAANSIDLTAGMRANLYSLQQTDALLHRTQTRLSTGKRVNSALDDPINYFAAQGHLQRSADLTVRKDEMTEAVQTVNAANAGIEAITALIENARSLAQSALSADTTEASNLAAQFDDVLDQIDTLAADSGYKGVNLLNSDSLTVAFNETGDSDLEIEGFSATSGGLEIADATGSWANDADITAALTDLDTAKDTLRSEAKTLSSNLNVITARQDFTQNMINTLEDGAANLTLADMNEEGANMLMLQTRQALGTTSLSLASQAAQSVLRLF